MGRVHFVGEAVGRETSAKMVAAAGGDVKSAADFFVLNIPSGNRKHLCSEAQFAEFAGDRIARQLMVVRLDCGGITLDQGRVLDAPPGHMHEAESAVPIFHGEFTFRADRHVIDLPGGQIGHIGLATAAKAVAFLCFLPAEFKFERVLGAVIEVEIEFDGVGAGHALAKFFRFDTDLVVVHRQAGTEDDVVDPVQGGTAETVLLGRSGERGGGRIGGNAENKIVVRIDVLFETELATVRRKRLIGQIQVAPARKLVSINLAALEP